MAESYSTVADDDYLKAEKIGALMGPAAIRKALQEAYQTQGSMFHIHRHDHRGVPGFSPVDLSENAKFIPDFWKVARQDLKVEVISRRILAVNPKAIIRPYPSQWEVVADKLKSSAVIFGCVDSYRVRAELEDFARRYLIPYIDIGMDVNETATGYSVSGQLILSLPDHHCMRCFGFITEARLSEEAKRYGQAGSRPQVVWPNGSLASAAVGAFIQLTLPWSITLKPPLFLEYDGNRLTLTPSNKLAALADRRCPHFDGPNMLGDIDWGNA